MQETWFNSWVGKIHWRRNRLPTPVFLGFPDSSAGKESACNVGDLGSIPGLWNHLPHIGTWTMWLGLKPSQTHGTWFQDLMKLRFLMFHCRKNSVRDKVIGKWIYSDTERSTLHRQSVGHCRGWMQPWNLVWLVFIGWVISYANKWEDYSNYFGEGVEISRIWATTHSLVF